MYDKKKLKEKILLMIEKLKDKNLLVEVEFLDEKEDKFAVYGGNELNSVHYKVTYAPKGFFLTEGDYYLKFFPSFLSGLDSKAERIDYLLKDLNKDTKVTLEHVEYNSYFHFTKDEVIINIDSFSNNLDIFKEILKRYDKNPKIFLRNIVSSNLSYDYNDLVKKGKMRYFKSTIYNVKIQGKKYIVFNTSNSFEKIMYILDEEDEFLDIMNESYIKVIKKLALINGL